MAKSGRTHYYSGGGKETVFLKKGAGPTYARFQKQIIATAMRMKLSGKTEDEIVEWLEEKYGKDLF